MPDLAFLLSGDYPEIGKLEIESLLNSNLELKASSDRILVYSVNEFQNIRRLALSKEIVEVFDFCLYRDKDLYTLIEKAVKNFAETLSLNDTGLKYCVRVKNFVNKRETNKLERHFGSFLWKKGLKISVSKPDVVLKVYICKEFAVVGKLIHTQQEKFNERHPKKRPFFKPGVILPKLCRALVNITLREGLLLDPMCGTGGFLIEAGLMGLDFIGVELYKDIALGCAKNLKHFGLKCNVLCGDARNLPLQDCSIDGIVTDYPYYVSSKSYTDSEKLHRTTAEEFERVLKPKSRAVIVTNIDAECYFDSNFRIIDKYRLRVHGSLTRRIYVCEKV